MKEIIKGIGIFVLGLLGAIIFFFSVGKLTDLLVRTFSRGICVEPVTKYYIEINNGDDKYAGTDYEKAKEFAQGRLIYPMEGQCNRYVK